MSWHRGSRKESGDGRCRARGSVSARLSTHHEIYSRREMDPRGTNSLGKIRGVVNKRNCGRIGKPGCKSLEGPHNHLYVLLETSFSRELPNAGNFWGFK